MSFYPYGILMVVAALLVLLVPRSVNDRGRREREAAPAEDLPSAG